MAYTKIYAGQKLLNANVDRIVLVVHLVDLNEVLYIHILNKSRYWNCTRGGNTCIWRSHLPLSERQNSSLTLKSHWLDHRGCHGWIANISTDRNTLRTGRGLSSSLRCRTSKNKSSVFNGKRSGLHSRGT